MAMASVTIPSFAASPSMLPCSSRRLSIPTFAASPSSYPSSSGRLCLKSMSLSLASSSPKPLGFLLNSTKLSYNDSLRPTPVPRLKIVSTYASGSASTPTPTIPTGSLNPLSDSTRTISAVLSTAFWLSRLVLSALQTFSHKVIEIAARNQPTPEELAKISSLRESLICSVGPLFFAALKGRPRGYLNTPLAVVAAGMAKWLDIYSGVLMVRVLLSWFPNIPWERQPLSAIRDLCDPYLNLFRNIIPPVFDTLDVSPLLAFAVLGTLGSILNSSRGMY